jgi:hypothetical protein
LVNDGSDEAKAQADAAGGGNTRLNPRAHLALKCTNTVRVQRRREPGVVRDECVEPALGNSLSAGTARGEHRACTYESGPDLGVDQVTQFTGEPPVVLDLVTVEKCKQFGTVRRGRHRPPPRTTPPRPIDGEPRHESTAIDQCVREVAEAP